MSCLGLETALSWSSLGVDISEVLAGGWAAARMGRRKETSDSFTKRVFVFPVNKCLRNGVTRKEWYRD